MTTVWPPETVATHCEPVGLVQMAETSDICEVLKEERAAVGVRHLRRPGSVLGQLRRWSNRIGTYFGVICGSILGITLSTTSGKRSGNWLRK